MYICMYVCMYVLQFAIIFDPRLTLNVSLAPEDYKLRCDYNLRDMK